MHSRRAHTASPRTTRTTRNTTFATRNTTLTTTRTTLTASPRTTLTTTLLCTLLVLFLFAPVVSSRGESASGGDFRILPVIGSLSFSSQQSNIIRSHITTVEPGIIFRNGDTLALSFVELSYSQNSLNTVQTPELSGLTIADTTSYSSYTVISTPRYTLLGIFGGTSFDDNITTRTVLDTALLGGARNIDFGDSTTLSLGLGAIYLRNRDALYPIPIFKLDITAGKLFTSIGYPLSLVQYTVAPSLYSISGNIEVQGSTVSGSLMNTYTPTKHLLFDLAYSYKHGIQTYGFLQNNTILQRISQDISAKALYRYFYVESSYYFTSNLRRIDPSNSNSSSSSARQQSYREKPFATVALGVEYRK